MLNKHISLCSLVGLLLVVVGAVVQILAAANLIDGANAGTGVMLVILAVWLDNRTRLDCMEDRLRDRELAAFQLGHEAGVVRSLR